jgi:hypothetical protein
MRFPAALLPLLLALAAPALAAGPADPGAVRPPAVSSR